LNYSASYAGKNEWQAAADDAKECIKLDPSFVKGYYRLATAQIELDDLEGATKTIKQGLNVDQKNPQLSRQLQMVKQRQKYQRTPTSKAVSIPRVVGDSSVSKELQELHQQYVQTLREHQTVEANLTKARREYKSHQLTKLELDKLAPTEEARMYRSVGKMFLLSSRQQVMERLDKDMETEKKREEDLLQKQDYLERRLKSQQQNIQELLPKQ
jgi:chaperonin cofactor prefoldin